MTDLVAPRFEGVVPLRDGRREGFAEFGDPAGRPVVWLHGTPGARRQIPDEARVYAAANGIRLLGIDRPGVGLSTPYVYPQIRDFASDLATIADALDIEDMAIVGLSGGGPFALAAGAVLGTRVRAVGVLGGVAPTKGPDSIDGGLVAVGVRCAPLLRVGRLPLSLSLAALLRTLGPLASPLVDLYARVSPSGDRRLLNRAEIKAMFIDDLFGLTRHRFEGPIADVIAFTEDWGFRLEEVRTPVVWWHGDADHIVPFSHGVHMTERLPHSQLRVLSGESHLAGLGIAREILETMLEMWELGAPFARCGDTRSQ